MSVLEDRSALEAIPNTIGTSDGTYRDFSSNKSKGFAENQVHSDVIKGFAEIWQIGQNNAKAEKGQRDGGTYERI